MKETNPRSDLMRLRRNYEKAHYDEETVHKILDATFLCHIGYAVDGAQLVTPTVYCRIGNTVYLHGSSASRMMRTLVGGAPMAFTVSIVDGLVLARSGFEHSVHFRSVMATGAGFEITDLAEKNKIFDAFVDKIAEGRSAEVRPSTSKESKATKIVGLMLENVSAKVSANPAMDEPGDYDRPVWAGVVPIETRVLPALRDKNLADDIPEPEYLSVSPIKSAW